MTVLKRCELCKNYVDCKIYDKVCDNLKFLQNFLDIKKSEDIGKYCKNYCSWTKKGIKDIKRYVSKEIYREAMLSSTPIQLHVDTNQGIESSEFDEIKDDFIDDFIWEDLTDSNNKKKKKVSEVDKKCLKKKNA